MQNFISRVAQRGHDQGIVGPIRLNNVVYARDLGVHAASDVRYSLSGLCTTFQSDVGVDDEVGTGGSVVFQVWADGSQVYDSGTMTGSTATKQVSAGIAGVNELRLVVTDSGNGNSADHADWAGARVLCGAETHLSDLTWASATNAWGPVEQDQSNGEQLLGDGRTLTLNGVTYSKGLGAHGASEVRYSLGGLCNAFLTDIGLDDEVGTGGSVVFQVWADGSQVYDSGAMTGSTATKQLNISVAGKNELRLVVTDGGNGNGQDHADWANARVVCGSAVVAPPTTVSVNDNTLGTGTNQFEYVGAWSYGSQSGAYQNDNHWSNAANAYYQVRFNGTQAKLYMARASAHGIAAVSIDGGAETMVDLYAATRADGVLVYTSPALSNGAHTLKVRVTGTKNASAGNTYVIGDRVDAQ